MSPKSFGVLVLGTAVALALAGWAVASRDVPSASRTVDAPLFANLPEQLDKVAVIRVEGDGKTATLKRDGDVWRVEERAGYPADPAKVREVARGLAALRLVEAKTATTDKLPRLQLEDPAAKDAKSKSVTLEDGEGKPLAGAILGKERYDLYGGGRGGLYVRRAGEDQAWLAAGSVNLPGDPLDWIATTLVDLPSSDLARVTLGADTPSAVVLSKTDKSADSFTLANLPDGQAADAEKIERIGSLLESLTMQDVQPASAKPVPPGAPKARFETWDGLVITASVLVEGEGDKAERWVSLDASEEPPPGVAATSAAPAATKDAAPADKPAAEQAAKTKPVAERVTELDQRLNGWMFKLPNWLAERLTYKQADLLTAPQEKSGS